MSILNGDTVLVHYTGKFADGTVFDSSEGGEPLEFIVGDGQVIEGFDAAVLGRAQGDTIEVTIPAAQAYGERMEELVFSVQRDQIPEPMAFEKGLELTLTMGDEDVNVVVADVTDETVTLDANHPLAGEDLTFIIEVVSVRHVE